MALIRAQFNPRKRFVFNPFGWKKWTPDPHHFHGCPECPPSKGPDNIYNAGRAHRAACHTHRMSWLLGSNLFSSWRNETEAEQRERFREIEDYEDLTPHPEVIVGPHRFSDDMQLGAKVGIPEFDLVIDRLVYLAQRAMDEEGIDRKYAPGWISTYRDSDGTPWMSTESGPNYRISERVFWYDELVSAFCSGQAKVGIDYNLVLDEARQSKVRTALRSITLRGA